MTIEIPDEWVSEWKLWDELGRILAASPTLSAASVSATFHSAGGGTKRAAFMAWLAIRHGVTGYMEFRDRLLKGHVDPDAVLSRFRDEVMAEIRREAI